jgi:hypothetical protein
LLPLSYPSSTESDYSFHQTPWWQIYYSHKYLRPKKRAFKGSDLEVYFRNLRFHFEPPKLEDAKEITIGAVGDLMCRKDLAGPGSELLFDEIGEALFSTDLSIGNLEFAVNPNVYFHKLLRFSVPRHYATPLLDHERFGKFDVVSLANNHINDSFHEGISETCNFLDSVGIEHTGANRTPSEQDEILILERSGAKIAILSYTFSTNGIPLEAAKAFGTNVIRFNALNDAEFDPSLILKHIELAKRAGADYIISCHHWGIDLELYPPPRIVNRAHLLLDAGIDLIIGHHPHVLGPIDHYQTQDGRDGLIFYSLGNITSKGLIFPIQRLAALANVSLLTGLDGDGKRVVAPLRVEMTPTLFTVRKKDGVKRGFIRKVKENIRRMQKGDHTLDLSLRERMELKFADRMYRKYFELEDSGIVYH